MVISFKTSVMGSVLRGKNATQYENKGCQHMGVFLRTEWEIAEVPTDALIKK